MRPNFTGINYAIIRNVKPIATDNYDIERLITDGYAYVDAISK